MVTTTTPAGQNIGSAVTDAQGRYAINGVSSGLYYIMLTPPAGANFGSQNAASYVGDPGLTVNWSVASGRQALATAMPGTTNNNPGALVTAGTTLPNDPKKNPPGCEKKHIIGPPCGP
jgi:hypothetical protein